MRDYYWRIATVIPLGMSDKTRDFLSSNVSSDNKNPTIFRDLLANNLLSPFAETSLEFCCTFLGWINKDYDPSLLHKIFFFLRNLTITDGSDYVYSEGFVINSQYGHVQLLGAYPLLDIDNEHERRKEYSKISFLKNNKKINKLLDWSVKSFINGALQIEKLGIINTVTAISGELADNKICEILTLLQIDLENTGFPTFLEKLVPEPEVKQGYESSKTDTQNMNSSKRKVMPVDKSHYIFFLNVAASGGYIWFFDKYNLINSLVKYFVENDPSGFYGEDVFPYQKKIENLVDLSKYFRGLWKDKAYEDKIINNYLSLIDKIDFSRKRFTENEANFICDFFSYLYDDLTFYGDIDDLINDQKPAISSEFTDDSGELKPKEKIIEMLNSKLWWT